MFDHGFRYVGVGLSVSEKLLIWPKGESWRGGCNVANCELRIANCELLVVGEAANRYGEGGNCTQQPGIGFLPVSGISQKGVNE